MKNLRNPKLTLKLSRLSVPFLGLLWLIAVQCGGSSSATEGSAIAINTGNLKPQPLVRTKWVYEIQQNGETIRMAKEITALSSRSWTEIDIYEGIAQKPTQTSFEVIDGKTYTTSVSAASGLFSYSEPGQRLRIEASELPFSESYRWTFLGSSGFGAATQMRSYTFLGRDTVQLGLNAYSVVRMMRTSEVQNTSGGFDVFERRELWESDQLGLVRESVTNSDGSQTIKVLKSFQTTSNVTVGSSEITSTDSPLILTRSSDIPSDTAAAHLREIYELSQGHASRMNMSRLPVEYAQGIHLYLKYYLFQNQIPENLSAYDTLPNLVSQLSSLDPYTFYFNPSQYSNFVSQISGEKAIIGLRLGINNSAISDVNSLIDSSNQLTVLEVSPLSRAWHDGFAVGDVITKIDDNLTDGKTFSQALELLPSTESSQVTVHVERDGKTIEIVTAAETHLAEIMNSNVAYLNVRKFTATTGSEVKKDFDALKESLGSEPSGVILDLRYNSGGSTVGARELVDYLIDNDDSKQNIIYRIKNNEIRYYLGDYASDNMGDYGVNNFVVLINDESASASEVTAGALKHYGKAKVIGKQSFGKGVSQRLFGLVDGSGLAVTNYEILLPADQSYHGLGISPDICYTTSPSSPSSDLQLQAALEYLSSGNVTGAEACTASSKAHTHRKKNQKDPWIPHFLKDRY